MLSDPDMTASNGSTESGNAPLEVGTTGVETDGRSKAYVTPTVSVLNVRRAAPGWFGMKKKTGQVQAGDSLRVESEDDGWLKIYDATSGSELGWVHGDYVTDLRPGLADSLRSSMKERQRRTARMRAKSEEAIRAVAARLGPNRFGIGAGHLLSKENPRGEGTFVYVRQTRFNGVKRNIMWLVIDGQAYSLNGATKGILTPSSPWPREAPSEVWSRTGLDKFQATEAIEIVFG